VSAADWIVLTCAIAALADSVWQRWRSRYLTDENAVLREANARLVREADAAGRRAVVVDARSGEAVKSLDELQADLFTVASNLHVPPQRTPGSRS